MAKQERPLRRGWTTGTCAAAAAKAAFTALVTGEFPDPVEVTLPRGERPSFALAMTRKDDRCRDRRRRQGCRRRSGRDARRLDLRDRARGQERRRRELSRRRGRRHRDAARPSGSARRARDQSGAAPHDPRRHRRSGRRGGVRGRCRGRDLDSRRRSAGREDAQRPPRHRRRTVDPRHHRHRRAVFLLGLDPFDPSRHRRRPRRRA